LGGRKGNLRVKAWIERAAELTEFIERRRKPRGKKEGEVQVSRTSSRKLAEGCLPQSAKKKKGDHKEGNTASLSSSKGREKSLPRRGKSETRSARVIERRGGSFAPFSIGKSLRKRKGADLSTTLNMDEEDSEKERGRRHVLIKSGCGREGSAFF